MIRTPARYALLAATAAFSAAPFAAQTDIATLPLIVAAPQVVKPNLMFVLDDSGSMMWTHMPDIADDFTSKYGYAASQCNGIFYNPAITYAPPVTSTGASYANATFTGAWENGYDTGAGTVNLSTSFRIYTGYRATADYATGSNWSVTVDAPAVAAYYYKYTGTITNDADRKYLDSTSTFYRECNSSIGSTPGSGVFTKVTVSATSGPGSTDERQNFANWYSYYRTRMQAMKSAAGIAFKTLDDSYRVGYYSLNNHGTTPLLNLNTFDATQKSTWYSRLYAAIPKFGTPLRATLSDIGRMYAGTATSLGGTAVTDPVQYSCQKNFALLSTDGYWNGDGGVTTGGGAIGNEDNGQARPYGDTASGTLADVAAYYYKTDLRSLDNNVPASDDDPATWQHMSTFTLGLGVRGAMNYSPTYASDTSGDYYYVKNGTTATSTICPWTTLGQACNWPTPAADSYYNVDDLWHAAVNGRGKYIGARDPATLASGLIDALDTMKTISSSGQTSGEGSPNVSSSNNLRFYTSYKSGEWIGDVKRFDVNVSTGEESTNPIWSARTQLDAATTRTVYTYTTATASKLKDFTWAQLTTAEQAWFTTPYISGNSTDPLPLTQFCTSGDICLSSANQAAASGAPLVSFLRGDRTNEGALMDLTKYFRKRTSVLGDMVGSRAVHVTTPPYLYTDTGYAAYKTAQAGRAGTVYVGANDGMVHAFDAATGNERWAYMPGLVLPGLFKLADKRYASRHRYYVDGSPVEGDVYSGGSWRTILVGGLNRGGRGYYALDVTNPASPQALWEFTDTNMGYTFGRPEITKLKTGQWVVMVTSGYNNVSPGDGRGYLYILDAITGQQISGSPMTTGVGDTTTPSGFAQIRAWVDNGAYNNTALRVYGGDLNGNLFRFDVNNDIPPAGRDVFRLAQLVSPSGAAQPITTRPEMTKVRNRPVIYVATGRTLGVTDISTTDTQTLYAIKDSLDSTGFTNPRGSSTFVRQTIATSGTTRVASNTLPVDFRYVNGWYIDLPGARERADTDPQLAFGVLAIATNAPNNQVCSVGGTSYLNFFNYANGGAVSSSSALVSYVNDNLSSAIALTVISDPSNHRTLRFSSTDSAGDRKTGQPPQPEGKPAIVTRNSWREIPQE